MFVKAIVGSGEEKFTPITAVAARIEIFRILTKQSFFKNKTTGPADRFTSGKSPLRGIDIWSEEMADRLGVKKKIFPAKVNSWSGGISHYGYRERNIDIAEYCTEIHVIVPREYPRSFTGQRFKKCYHCNKDDHIKSGGCWTAKRAQLSGKPVMWHIIYPSGQVFRRGD